MTNKTLITSISGIRGIFGAGLSPEVLVRYASAYARWCIESGSGRTVVIGRDARTTGEVCARIVSGTIAASGLDVFDAGLTTTPTVEMAVIREGAAGGIVLSASHNPGEWNALKLLNGLGEFLSPDEGARVLQLAAEGVDSSVGYRSVGKIVRREYLEGHIEAILDLPFIDAGKIGSRGFSVVVDGVNSVGGIAVPALLQRLGVTEITCVNCDPTGVFAHPAEPLPENLADTLKVVRETGTDLGIVVDPDVDRLALIEPGGRYLSEELTQVVAADFMWRFRDGPFVTNLSSSRAIDDVAGRYGQDVYRSAVGEINVVKKMQEVGAILGGEGSGGVILPDLHYGRDALVGVAIVLQHLANEGLTLAEERSSLPTYHISKKKVEIGDADPEALLGAIAEAHAAEGPDLTDGVKIDLDDGWVHIRRSNTEPIMRVYSEGRTPEAAAALGERFVSELRAVSRCHPERT